MHIKVLYHAVYPHRTTSYVEHPKDKYQLPPSLQDLRTQNIIRIQCTKQLHIKPSPFIDQSTSHLINRDDTQNSRNIRFNNIINRNSQVN